MSFRVVVYVVLAREDAGDVYVDSIWSLEEEADAQAAKVYGWVEEQELRTVES